DPDFWACMAERFPGVALDVQAYKIVAWLKKPLKKNRTAACSQGFLVNWLEGAASGRYQKAPPVARPAPGERPERGMVIGGSYVQPAALQRQPEPPGLVRTAGPMERISAADMLHVPLAARLAQSRGGGT